MILSSSIPAPHAETAAQEAALDARLPAQARSRLCKTGNNIFLSHACLIDPATGKITEDSLLVVKDGRFVYAGPFDIQVERAAEAEGILGYDLRGHTILPSLADAHVHLTSPLANQGRDPGAEIRQQAALKNIALALKNGITIMRDCGDWNGVSAQIRDAERLHAGVELAVTGRPITTPGGHMHQLGIIASSKDELRRAVEQAAADGADCIKVCASGGFVTPQSSPAQVQYSTAQLSAIMEAAARHNKKVIAHAHCVQAIQNCVEAGVHSVEHGSFIGLRRRFKLLSRLLDKMASQGTFLAGTITRHAVLAKVPSSPGVEKPGSSRFISRLSQVYRSALQHGVKLILSTDAWGPGNEFGYFPEMLQNAVQRHQLPLMEVLRAVTTTPRQAPGVKEVHEANGRAGQETLAEEAAKKVESQRQDFFAGGGTADFIVLKGNPLHDLAALGRVHLVVRAGKKIEGLEDEVSGSINS